MPAPPAIHWVTHACSQCQTRVLAHERILSVSTDSLLAQEYKSSCERHAASRERYARHSTPFPIDAAVAHILSQHATFVNAALVHGQAAVRLAARLTQQLGARVSADAAVAVLTWFRERHGDAVRPPLYDAAIVACAVNFAPEAALKVFAAMRAAGVRGTTRSLNMLIAACTQAGFADLALEVCRAPLLLRH